MCANADPLQLGASAATDLGITPLSALVLTWRRPAGDVANLDTWRKYARAAMIAALPAIALELQRRHIAQVQARAPLEGLQGPQRREPPTTTMINCLQINLNGCWAAQQLLTQKISERGIGLLILSEHYSPPSYFPSWAVSTDGRCSIALTVAAGQIAEETGSGPGFAWLKFGGAIMFSCYSPNGPTAAEKIESFNRFLDGLEGAIRNMYNIYNIYIIM